MPLDPTAEAMIKMITDARPRRSTPTRRPRSAGPRWIASSANPAFPKHPVHAVDDRTIPDADRPDPGARVSARPTATDLPVLVWFHGGGWVTCSLDTHDQLCRLLCDAVGCVVVSVDYRLAPETKFPGAVDDCVAAYDWATRHARRNRRRHRADRDRRRQRGRQPRRGRRAASRASAGSRNRSCSCSCIPVDRLRVRQRVDDRQREGLLPRSRQHASGSTITTRGPRPTSTTGGSRRSARRDLARPSARRRHHRRVRPAARPGRGVRPAAAGRRRADRDRARRRPDPRLLRNARRSCRPRRRHGTSRSPRCATRSEVA